MPEPTSSTKNARVLAFLAGMQVANSGKASRRCAAGGGDDQQRTSSRAQLSADHRSPYRSIALGGVINLKERASINLILLRKGRTHMECPTCESQELRLSHRRSLLERAVSLISFRPFRCRDCNSRFWRFRGRRRLRNHYRSLPLEAERE